MVLLLKVKVSEIGFVVVYRAVKCLNHTRTYVVVPSSLFAGMPIS